MLDNECTIRIQKDPNMLVPWYLMSAYAYYVEDNPILTDGLFDEMSKRLLKEYEAITHFHKEFISKDQLMAGTFLGKYPSRVKGALEHARQKFKHN